jgi:hexosaminidase
LPCHTPTDGSEPDAQSPTFGDVLDRYTAAPLKATFYRHGLPYLTSRMFQMVNDQALGKQLVTDLTAPDVRYAGTDTQLVNGVIGKNDDDNDGLWVGWRGSNLAATIELKPATPMHTIQVRLLQQSGS